MLLARAGLDVLLGHADLKDVDDVRMPRQAAHGVALAQEAFAVVLVERRCEDLDGDGAPEGFLVAAVDDAATAAAYLVEHHGIQPERLTPIGKGASELLDTKNPNAPVNRRVTIVTSRG